MDYLIEYETDEGAGAASVGAGADAGAEPSPEPAAGPGAGEGEPASSTGATEAAPAWTPEQIQALRDQPGFREFVAEEAGTIAEARFNALLEQRGQTQEGQQGQQGQTGEQFDANEFLNPFGDNYGQNMLQLLQANTAQTLQAVQQMIQPLTQHYEADTATQGDELLKDAVKDMTTREGDLLASDEATQRVIADVRNRFYPETAAMYGETNRAAEIAIEKAVRAERAYQKQIGDAAVEQYKNRLGTLEGVRGEAGVGTSGAETFSEKPLTAQELALKYGGKARAIRA